MANLVFASIAPHPPILLPDIGFEKDKVKVKKTIDNLKLLAAKFKEANPDSLIISSPHPDWGFNVPLFFLAPDYKNEIIKELIEIEQPLFYFEKGKEIYSKLAEVKRYSLIASGDMSHCLKENGPYGFNPEGPEFDRLLIDLIIKKDIKKILGLDQEFPHAGECGLRSFCFLFGILEEHSRITGQIWKPEILSYEGPFGVGYLVANFKLY